MKRSVRVSFLSFVLLLFLHQGVHAHPMDLTVSNLKYSKQTLTLSTRIFYGDFYNEFKNYTKVKNKDYVTKGFDAVDRKDFANYFRKNFRIWVGRSEIRFTSMNLRFEPHDDVFILLVDLSYTVDIPKGAKIKIRNSILLDSIKDQKNRINVFLRDPKMPSHGILTFDKKKPEAQFVNN